MNILKRLVHMYYGLMFYFKYRTAYNMQTKKYTPNQKEFIKSFNEVKNICLTSENFNTLVSEKLTLLLNNPTDIGIIHSFVGIMGGVFVNNCPKLQFQNYQSMDVKSYIISHCHCLIAWKHNNSFSY